MAWVVITRDAEAAAPYAAALARLGLDAVALAVTRIEPVAAGEAALAAALGAGGHAAIFVASRHAAAALVRAVQVAGRPPELVRDVFAVGPATAAVLAAGGLRVEPLAHGADGESLARAIAAARPLGGAGVLVPCADDRRAEPLAILRAAGARVDEVIVYRTAAAPLADARAQLAGAAACVVFAPSQVAALAALVAPAGLASLRAPFVAIGRTTAAALAEHGVTAAVAAAPTPEGVAEALGAVYPPQR